jgi:hypothetical protein
MRVLALTLLCVPAVFGGPAESHSVKRCPAVDVQSVRVSAEFEPASGKPASTDVEKPETASPRGTLSAVARGPIFGSMDSHEVKTSLSCTAEGVTLTATITRAAGYNGSTLKNVLWRPKITVVVMPLRPEIHFDTVWQVKLSNGKELRRAATPPFPEVDYPVVVKRVFSASPLPNH